MKITHFETIKLKFPLNKPMRTRYMNIEHSHALLLMLKTDTGDEGQGLIRAVTLANIKIIENCIHTIFAPQFLHKEFISAETLWQSLWLFQRNHLQSSFALYALAAIDIAAWDIEAQQQGQALHQLFNINQPFVVPYGNGGWLTDTPQNLLDDIQWYLEKGCNHFKMRIGSEQDITRLKLIRKTFADSLILSVDANQFYDFKAAIEMSKQLAEFKVLWFEEPLFSNSIVKLANLAELSPTPIATGENMNSHWQVQDICQLKAAQILQPDVIYQGGISEFKRSANIINQAKLTLGAHLFHELSASLAGLCDSHYVEHIDFYPNDFFTHDFSIREGKIQLPTFPGHGVKVTPQAIKKYQI